MWGMGMEEGEIVMSSTPSAPQLSAATTSSVLLQRDSHFDPHILEIRVCENASQKHRRTHL